MPSLTAHRAVRLQVRQDLDLNFFVVRGDSAQIPPQLMARGFRPDTTRWYIERLEDTAAALSTLIADGARSVPMARASVYTAPRRSHPSSLEPSARRPGRER